MKEYFFGNYIKSLANALRVPFQKKTRGSGVYVITPAVDVVIRSFANARAFSRSFSSGSPSFIPPINEDTSDIAWD
jgi:hypothetical protein